MKMQNRKEQTTGEETWQNSGKYIEELERDILEVHSNIQSGLNNNWGHKGELRRI
jgi:hypothetical protein